MLGELASNMTTSLRPHHHLPHGSDRGIAAKRECNTKPVQPVLVFGYHEWHAKTLLYVRLRTTRTTTKKDAD